MLWLCLMCGCKTVGPRVPDAYPLNPSSGNEQTSAATPAFTPDTAGAQSSSVAIAPTPPGTKAGTTVTTASVPSLFDNNSSIITVEITKKDWATFSASEPKAKCDFNYIGPQYDWGTVESVKIGTTVFSGASIQKRSACESFSDSKPSFALRFDNDLKTKAIQLLGHSSIVLNNSVPDDSYLRECFAFDMFRKAGVAAPRCLFARVTVNGAAAGLYIAVEPIDAAFVEKSYGKPVGNLYEFAGEYFASWALPRVKRHLETFSGDFSLHDITNVMDTIEPAKAGDVVPLVNLIDNPSIMNFWATEILLAHWDGLMESATNSYIYFGGSDGKMRAIPWGTDYILNATSSVKTNHIYATLDLPFALSQTPVQKAALARVVWRLLDTQWQEPTMESDLRLKASLIESSIEPTSLPAWRTSVESLIAQMKVRRKQVEAFLPRQ